MKKLMGKTLIASMPGSEDIGEKIALALNAAHAVLETKIFPDGESYVRYPIDPGKYDMVIVVQRAYPEQDRRLIKALLAAHAARDLGAKEIHVVLPYLPYARQDRRFREGEVISLKAVLELFRGIGVKSIVAVDVHKPEAFHIENLRCINVEPFREYARAIREVVSGGDVVLLSPDLGSYWRVRKIAEALNVPFDHLEKSRDRVTGEITIRPKEIDVKGKFVFIIDDIIATGSTIAEAARILRSRGAAGIGVIATHCLMLGDAEAKLKSAGVEPIICSNTIPTAYSRIDVSGIIAEALKSTL